MKEVFFLQFLRYRANLQDVNISPHLNQVILKIRGEFCSPSKLKCKPLKRSNLGQGLFLLAAFFTLYDTVLLSTCFFFSECFQVTPWRVLDHMHSQFQEITF